MSDPHPLVRQACALLTASLAYRKINVGKAPSFKLGNVSVRRDMDAWRVYKQEYREVVNQINDRSLVNIAEAPSIPGMNFYDLNPTPDVRNKNEQYIIDTHAL